MLINTQELVDMILKMLEDNSRTPLGRIEDVVALLKRLKIK